MKALPHALVLAALPAIASAATLVRYDFSGGTPQAATEVAPAFGAGSFASPGAALVATYDTGWAKAQTDSVAGTSTVNPGTEAGSITANDYFAFTLTPAAGVYHLSSLGFGTALYTVSTATQTLAASYFIRSSLDGYTTTIGGPFLENHQGVASNAGVVFHPQSVDLTGAAFRNLSGPVTFRIYLYDTTNSNARFVALDDITLSGTVVLEPASIALAVAGGGFLSSHCRRI